MKNFEIGREVYYTKGFSIFKSKVKSKDQTLYTLENGDIVNVVDLYSLADLFRCRDKCIKKAFDDKSLNYKAKKLDDLVKYLEEQIDGYKPKKEPVHDFRNGIKQGYRDGYNSCYKAILKKIKED